MCDNDIYVLRRYLFKNRFEKSDIFDCLTSDCKREKYMHRVFNSSHFGVNVPRPRNGKLVETA